MFTLSILNSHQNTIETVVTLLYFFLYIQPNPLLRSGAAAVYHSGWTDRCTHASDTGSAWWRGQPEVHKLKARAVSRPRPWKERTARTTSPIPRAVTQYVAAHLRLPPGRRTPLYIYVLYKILLHWHWQSGTACRPPTLHSCMIYLVAPVISRQL
jgi:hypothetical protein